MKRPQADKTQYDPSSNPSTSATNVKQALDDVGTAADAATLTASDIKTLYESNANTNAFTDADETKLDGIESGATADQTASEIKTLYESNSDTNAFTDADEAKLDSLSINASGEFIDNTFAVVDDGDNTKKIAFQASGITTGTTRTFTAPDENGTLLTTTYSGGDVTFDTNTFHVDSTNNRVGIGATSPGAKVEIVHAALGVEGEPIRLSRTTSPDQRYHSIKAIHSGVEATNEISFHVHDASTATSQTEVLTLRGDGNVGIGTASPAAKLDVNGIIKSNHIGIGTSDLSTDLAYSPKVKLSGTGPAVVLEESDTTGEWVFAALSSNLHIRDATNTTNVMSIEQGAGPNSLYIDSAGDIGIGTTTINAKLDVDGVIKVKSFTVGTLPTAVVGGMIYVSDETGGAVTAFSDGTNWRRVTDRAVVA